MKKIKILIMLLLLLTKALTVNSQQRIVISDKEDQTADPSAVLDLISEDKGFLLPRMETNERNNIDDAAESLIIFNTETNCVETYVQGEWHELWCKPAALTGCEGVEGGVEYNGHTYEVVEIGYQCWFAENLRYDNGCSSINWENNIDVGWCGFHEDDDEEEFGLLYQWSAAMDNSGGKKEQGICPDDWRIPNHDDWTYLERYICNDAGNDDCEIKFPYDEVTTGYRGTDEGDRLKIDDDPNWCNITCNDQYGFSALPSGRRSTTGMFLGFEGGCRWWVSTESDTSAWRRYLNLNNSEIGRDTKDKSNGFSVRCIRNP